MADIVKTQASYKNIIILNFAVLLFGFTGILGALISISAAHLIWYRLIIGIISLYAYLIFTGTSLKINPKKLGGLTLAGALLAACWLCFFQAIKISSVSITLVCFSAITLFTAILEPLFKRHKISLLEIAVGLVMIVGIYLIFKFETQYVWGIVLGLASALFSCLFNIINGILVKQNKATVICFYEILSSFLWVSVYLVLTSGFNAAMQPSPADMLYITLLGTLCTGVAYVANISVMKELSAFQVALVTNIEPVYGILMTVFILGSKEQMDSGFYTGGVIMLAAVFLYALLKSKAGNKMMAQR